MRRGIDSCSIAGCATTRRPCSSYSDLDTYRDAGQGGFEIRTFISVAAAARGRGHLQHYVPIPIFAVGCTIATMDDCGLSRGQPESLDATPGRPVHAAISKPRRT